MTLDFREIRRRISAGGHEFYETLGKKNDDLQNIAGEFMSLNEDYCLQHPDTYGYHDILKTGFSDNQKSFLLRIAKALEGKGAVCSWCGKPGPKHEGGMQKMNGEEISGLFCERGCFDLWQLAHTLIENRTPPMEKK